MIFSRLSARAMFEFSSPELALMLTECFEGYVAPFVINGPQFDRRFRPESIDSEASKFWFEGNQIAGVAMIARRGWTCRLAAMAVAKPFRGQKVGLGMMETVLSDAKSRGDNVMILEVVEQNPPAIQLYKKVGFEVRRRLAGYIRPVQSGVPADLKEIDPLEFCRTMVRECDLDLPWDFHPETLSAKSPPTQAWSLNGSTYALVSDTPADRIVLWGLYTEKSERRKGLAAKMVAGLAARFPDKTIVTPLAVPDDLAPGFFEKTGFLEASLSQFEMSQELSYGLATEC